MSVLFSKPRLETWALVAEIAGAVAVVISVMYLGKQINDNTKLLRSQAHFNALSLALRPDRSARQSRRGQCLMSVRWPSCSTR